VLRAAHLVRVWHFRPPTPPLPSKNWTPALWSTTAAGNELAYVP